MTVSNGVARLTKSRPRRYKLVVLLSMLLPSSDLQKCIEELLSHSSAIVARFGTIVENLSFTLSERSRIGLQEW